MNENKNFSLGGFPPIYESVSYLKKKEYVPNNILSIQSILSKRNVVENEIENDETDNFDAKQIIHDMKRISKGKSSKKKSMKKKKTSKK
jgi:hypothetical protein